MFYEMCPTGQQGVQLIYHEKIEVTEGQDAALPCILRNNTSQFSVVNMEWKKGRENATQLLVYNPQFSTVYHWSNITLRVDTSSMDSHLILRGVTSWDGGIYICVLSTFPWGNVIRETELKIRGEATCERACERALTLRLNCPLHIFRVAADCIRVLLLGPSHQLFNFEPNVVK